jgi:hypothetical protein
MNQLRKSNAVKFANSTFKKLQQEEDQKNLSSANSKLKNIHSEDEDDRKLSNNISVDNSLAVPTKTIETTETSHRKSRKISIRSKLYANNPLVDNFNGDESDNEIDE